MAKKKDNAPQAEEKPLDINMDELQEQLDAARQLAEDYLKLQEELEAANNKTAEYLGMAQRVQAEFENARRRNASVRTDSLSEGRCEVITALLPVMDNFDRAIQSIEDEASRTGVEMIYKQLNAALEGFGCAVCEPLGEVFDPNMHNAVMQSPAEEGEEPGTIVEVMQKGYNVDDKILRYPMVRVAQ